MADSMNEEITIDVAEIKSCANFLIYKDNNLIFRTRDERGGILEFAKALGVKINRHIYLNYVLYINASNREDHNELLSTFDQALILEELK